VSEQFLNGTLAQCAVQCHITLVRCK